ncbi:MAG: hypothetical protein JWO55_237 [Candidatus Saccharibacteria bacterium]|jgi:hypothetical protein|nr:hypothetical protein [Candidatus Saccharibacteria bacterium]
MSVLEKNSPPTIQPERPNLTDVQVYLARTGAAEEAKQAHRSKYAHEHFTDRHIETMLNQDAELQLGIIALSASASSSPEFTIPTGDN